MTQDPQQRSFGKMLCYCRGQTIDKKLGKPLSQEKFALRISTKTGLTITRNTVSNWEHHKVYLHPQKDRFILLAIIDILHEYKGIETLSEADQLLEAGDYRTLDDTEKTKIAPDWLLVTPKSRIERTLDEKSQTSSIFQAIPPRLRRTFDVLIADKAKGFIGRQFLFDALDDFLSTNPSGYFLIRGIPGIGKSAFMARLIIERGYIHHFNIASQNIRSHLTFVEVINTQLSARYQLLGSPFTIENARDSDFMMQCLSGAAAKTENRPIVIAIDALDESDRVSIPPSVNSLYLPYALPEGVYFVITTRPMDDMRLQVSNLHTLDLEADSAGNLQDISAYIENFSKREKMIQQVTRWGISQEHLIASLQKKSQGNFMYLHYVLPAIEKGKFTKGTVDELPDGLMSYYHRHWRQMNDATQDEFTKVYEPIICLLAVAQEPISVKQISSWSQLSQACVNKVIAAWREFLEEDIIKNERLYRIYHASFQDFLREHVDLEKYDNVIADYYLSQLGL